MEVVSEMQDDPCSVWFLRAILLVGVDKVESQLEVRLLDRLLPTVPAIEDLENFGLPEVGGG